MADPLGSPKPRARPEQHEELAFDNLGVGTGLSTSSFFIYQHHRTTQPAGWIAPSIHHTRPYDVITSLYRRECEGVSRNRRALLF